MVEVWTQDNYILSIGEICIEIITWRQ